MSENELKTIKRLTRSIWACVITLIVLIPSAAFYLGTLNERVANMEDSAILKSSEEWQSNEFKTRITYNRVFDLAPATRGGSIND